MFDYKTPTYTGLTIEHERTQVWP